MIKRFVFALLSSALVTSVAHVSSPLYLSTNFWFL